MWVRVAVGGTGVSVLVAVGGTGVLVLVAVGVGVQVFVGVGVKVRVGVGVNVGVGVAVGGAGTGRPVLMSETLHFEPLPGTAPPTSEQTVPVLLSQLAATLTSTMPSPVRSMHGMRRATRVFRT